MDKSKVEMFLMMNGKNLPVEKLSMFKDTLEKMDDDKFMFVQSLSFKDMTTAIILGILCVERIYLGQVGLGLLKLFLNFFIIGLIWWFIDLFSITKKSKNIIFNSFLK